jgi:hypothetical protein
VSAAARRVLAEQADAISETTNALVALDRRDLEAAYERASAALIDIPTLADLESSREL